MQRLRLSNKAKVVFVLIEKHDQPNRCSRVLDGALRLWCHPVGQLPSKSCNANKVCKRRIWKKSSSARGDKDVSKSDESGNAYYLP